MGDKNILFIMTDQMRADCMGCAGHPSLDTPNLDWLAANGVRFDRCYTPGAVCVPARASVSTGRYLQSHRVWWNEVPWPCDEKLMGHYLADVSMRSFQCGKSHYMTDVYTGVPPSDDAYVIGDNRRFVNSPFPDMETLHFNDGWQWSRDYNDYLRQQGYDQAFLDWPHQVRREDGTIERWKNDGSNSHLPCALQSDDTDTAFAARKAVTFLDDAPKEDWMLFLSWYRPHQPYCPSEPYYNRFDLEAIPEPVRSEAELADMHPLARAHGQRYLELMTDRAYWQWMRSAYYGLVLEIDHWVGQVLDSLRRNGLTDSTLIVFTSDHGDYLGDHWQFGKQVFYDQAHRVPLIVVDPSPDADATRGTVCNAWTQLVDILPAMLEYCQHPGDAAVQGRSILPFVHGQQPKDWRKAVFAAWDYRHCYTSSQPGGSRGFGVRNERYNYWFLPGAGDVLFDLDADPMELNNVAGQAAYAGATGKLRQTILEHLTVCSDLRRADWRFA